MNKHIIRIVTISIVIVVAFSIYWFAMRAPKKDTLVVVENRPAALVKTQVKTVSEGHDYIKEARGLLDGGKRAEAVRVLEKILSAQRGTRQAYEALLILANIYEEDNNLSKAKEAYLLISSEYPDYCNYPDIQKRLTGINIAIIQSPILTSDSEIYTVVSGDSLAKIAKRYSTTVELIKKANGLKTDLIRPGMKLKVQNLSFSVFVDKSQSTLTLILGDEVIKTYLVSTGKNGSTPVGVFVVKDKLIDPVWYSSGAIVAPGSPDNILGTRWMGLTTPDPGYGIHGTTLPDSIGYQCTEGCVRMRNIEVEELFAFLPIGAQVTVVE